MATGQTPKCCVLACADSRVPPEIVFDQGVGDLFVVRVAGNFADEDNQASLEYALQHFTPPPAVIVVLGHERCGAVQAAAISFDEASFSPKVVATFKHQPAPSDKLTALVTRLKPAIDATREDPPPRTDDGHAARLDTAVRWNVRDTVVTLQNNPVMKGFLEDGRLLFIGARYDLDTGEVEWLTDVSVAVEARGPGPQAS